MKLRSNKAKIKTEINQVNLKKKNDLIEKSYIKIDNPGSLGGVRKLYEQLKKKNKNIKYSDVENYISTQDEYSLHKPLKKKFARNKVLVFDIDDTWQIDLIDMKKFQKENNKISFILTIIDVFSKYAWGKLLLNKKAETVLEALKLVIEKSKRKPMKIHADQGNEFFNKHFKSYLEKQNIKIYITNSGLKASIIERFNRTIKEKIWRYFTAYKSTTYFDVFDDFFKSYNFSKHRSIKMRPVDVNQKNKDQVFFNLYGYKINESNEKEINVVFKKGDFVRISKYKNIFSKGYERNWQNEVFEIDKIIVNNSLPVYELKDLLTEKLEGIFYTQELQKVGINIRELEKKGEFEIDKVLDTRIKDKQKEFLVSWKYYPDSTNSWIKESSWVKRK